LTLEQALSLSISREPFTSSDTISGDFCFEQEMAIAKSKQM
jgi:hypothetical protein